MNWYKISQSDNTKSPVKLEAVIITGNPKYIKSTMAKKFYSDISEYLVSLGFNVKMNSGKPHTEPPKANLWIGHSRGTDRLQFAPKETKTLSFGSEGGINHPKDKSLKKGDSPDKYHFMFTKEMKSAIDKAHKKLS